MRRRRGASRGDETASHCELGWVGVCLVDLLVNLVGRFDGVNACIRVHACTLALCRELEVAWNDMTGHKLKGKTSGFGLG
jgi:hypothetical protein